MALTVPVSDIYGTQAGSAGFLMLCSCLVFIMTPGVGLLYSGLSRSKNALNILYLSFASYIVVTIQWYVIGFSLAFSENGSGFIGNGDFAFFMNMGSGALGISAPAVPALIFAMYQLQFAAVTVAIIFGSVAERCRILPALIFMVFWVTLVYAPVANWTWSARGWLRNLNCLNTYKTDAVPCGLGSIDFAGGGPVHMTSGFAGLAFAYKLGSRNFTATESTRPHNMVNIYIGMSMVWFGWLVFNGGSGGTASVRGVYAFTNTIISSAIGGIVWSVKDYMISGRWSTLGIVSGILAGLVGVTPASGFVAPWGAIIIGILTSLACNYACSIKLYIGVDDALDAFAVHGVGGFVGTILTGFFATSWVTAFDGTSTLGGVVDGQGLQLGYQLVAVTVIPIYTLVVTYLILHVIENVMNIPLRPSEDDELDGVDICDMGEIAYDLIPQEDKPSKTVEVVSN